MNTFYILLYIHVYENDSIFEYLDTNERHTKESLQTLSPLKTNNLINTLFHVMFHKYSTDTRSTLLSKLKIKLKLRLTQYSMLNKHILSNVFLSEETKDECIALFGKLQKHYHALSRFAHIWKWKRSQIPVTNDLYFNEIDITKSYNFILYQNGVRYYFRISDLLRSIEQKLINYDAFDFELLSEQPINPYNKMVLNKSDLYNIYFHILDSSMKIPLFLQLFFDEQFNFTIYTTKYDTYLRKLALKNYVFNESNTSVKLYVFIIDMLKENPYTKRLNIHETFPKSKVIDTFRNYVYITYLIEYGNLECDLQQYYENMLFVALKAFARHNPLFGRKIFTNKTFPPNSFNFTPVSSQMACSSSSSSSSSSQKPFNFHSKYSFQFNSKKV